MKRLDIRIGKKTSTKKTTDEEEGKQEPVTLEQELANDVPVCAAEAALEGLAPCAQTIIWRRANLLVIWESVTLTATMTTNCYALA